MLETIARSVMHAFLTGDDQAITTLFTDDATYEVTGRSPIAGMHYGHAALTALARQMQQHRTQYRYREQVSEVIIHEDAVIMLIQVGTERADQKRYWNVVQVLHFRDQQVDQGMMYLNDQYAFDEYWAA